MNPIHTHTTQKQSPLYNMYRSLYIRSLAGWLDGRSVVPWPTLVPVHSIDTPVSGISRLCQNVTAYEILIYVNAYHPLYVGM